MDRTDSPDDMMRALMDRAVKGRDVMVLARLDGAAGVLERMERIATEFPGATVERDEACVTFPSGGRVRISAR